MASRTEAAQLQSAQEVGPFVLEVEEIALFVSLLLVALVAIIGFISLRWALSKSASKRRLALTAASHQQRLRDFGALSGACLWELGQDLHFTYVSDNAVDVVGIAAHELIGKPPWACGDLARSPGTAAELRRLLQARVPVSDFVYSAQDVSGSRRRLRLNATPLLDAAGAVIGCRGIITDITAEDEAKRQAEQAHLRLCDAIEHIPAAIMLVDGDDRLALWNSQVGQYFAGARKLFVSGTPYGQVLAGITEKCLSARGSDDPGWLQRCVAGSRSRNEPAGPIQLTDGRWVQALDRPTSDGGTVSIWIDVTAIEERKAEFESKWALLRATLDNISQGVMLFDKDLRLSVWNTRYFELLDLPIEFAQIGTTLESFIRHRAARGDYGPIGIEEAVSQRLELVRRAKPYSVDCFQASGAIVEVRFNPVTAGGAIFTGTDITERKRREAEMREKTRLLQATFDNMSEGITVYDRELRLVARNDKFRELLDIPDDVMKLGITYQEVAQYQAARGEFGANGGQEVARRMAEVLKRVPQHYVRQRPNGRYIEVHRNPMPDGGFVSTYADVTDARNAQIGLVRAQKMEAIGHLSGGVAHEFNNLLTAIGGFARMTLRRPTDADHVKECIGEVVTATDRAASLTRQLLAYSRKQVLAATTVNVAQLAAETAKMLAPLLGETIVIETDIGAPDTAVTIDKDQLTQALVNLAVNARDAMPDGGRLTIRTGIEHMTEASLECCESCHPGTYAFVSITDTGTGMSKDVADRVFEPFFTTKEPGRGTGLGLSMVHGFVEQSHGAIKVKTALGEGTTITIYLPVATANDQQASDAAVEPDEIAVLGKRTILLVEDEDAVRRYFKRELEALGYTALIATCGEDALRLESEHPGPIDALVTDVVMPGIGGIETARRLRARRPDIKVVYMSGYIGRDPFDGSDLGEGRVFLDKPFPIERLLMTLNELFDGYVPGRGEDGVGAAA